MQGEGSIRRFTKRTGALASSASDHKPMTKVLVLNAGSGSQKVALYTIGPDQKTACDPAWQGAINSTTPGQPKDTFLAQVRSTKAKGSCPFRGIGRSKKRFRLLSRRRGRAASHTRRDLDRSISSVIALCMAVCSSVPQLW